jgi:hypothetical protein
VLGFWLYIQIQQYANHVTEVRNEREQKIIQLTQERDQARIEAESAKTAYEEKVLNEKRLELLLADALKRQDEIRTEARAQKAIFERHNLQALTDAKPGLIENLANKATQERMDAFENALNR